MNILDLCSGIGGFSLGLEWAGMRTVAFCEREQFCRNVLKKHWPNVPIFSNVKTLNNRRLRKRVKGEINVVTAGYPCQPFSTMGQRKGEEDDRHLWPWIIRIVSEQRPDWFIGENVVGHVNMGLDTVLFDLESEGYAAIPFIIPSAAVGGASIRERVFILAHSNGARNRRKYFDNGWRGSNVKRIRIWRNKFQEPEIAEGTTREDFEPGVCRIVDAFPGGVDRLKALGNAVDPLLIKSLGKAIMKVESEL